jgi:hypothetical protein
MAEKIDFTELTPVDGLSTQTNVDPTTLEFDTNGMNIFFGGTWSSFFETFSKVQSFLF